MYQYLLGHGYWSYVEGANDAAPEQDTVLLRVLCGRTTIELCSGCENTKGCVGESEEDLRFEHHSQEASAPTGVEQRTTTRFVGGGLHLKIKDICDSLASIEVNIEESEMVQICLRGLAPKFGAF